MMKRMMILSIGLLGALAAFGAKDFGDFYTRAWYLVVDNPGPAKSLSWRVFNVAPPGSYGNNVEDRKYGYEIRKETSPRRIDTPWMEVNFKTNLPISSIRIRPSEKPGEEFDLYGARLYLLDKDRRIVWHHRVWNADGQVDYDAGIEFSDRDQLGQVLPPHEFRAGLVSAPAPEMPKDLRLHLAGSLFNAAAMERAIRAYAAKHPSLFPDRDALLAEVARVASAPQVDAAAADALSRKVFLRLPAFGRFSEFLAIRRGDGNAMGMPQNWQGNSSIPVCGYSNAVVRAKVLGERTTLLESDSFLGDLALDYDLTKMAFSTRKPAEAAKGPAAKNGSHGGIGESGWCVGEMDLDRPGTFREITPTDTPDIDYYDPMYLPDGKMFLVGTVGFQGVPCVGGADQVGNLLLRERDGRLRRLSFDQDNNWNPVMLPNGRCLYLRWEYTDSAHYFARILMTMNPDGSDQQEFYGSNSYWPNSLFFTKPVPGSSTKFFGIVSGHHGVRRKGELVLFDVAKGRREEKGAVQKLPGWGQPVVPVTADRLVNDAHQFFLHPYPLSEEGVLVAMQDYSRAKHFFIAYVDVYDNQWPLLVSEDDSFNWLQPLPLERRERPFEVAKRVDETKTTAQVNVVNVYDGPGLAGVPKGTVKKLRVYNYEYCPRKSGQKSCGGHYLIGMEGPWDCRVMIGEVDVEEDGSVLFEAPANVPLVLQPLDAEGKHLQEMRSWFAAMPGETISCLGCHQDQNAAPPSGKRTIASTKPPQKLRPWYGPRRNFAFEREVVNVIERRCSGCHDGAPEKRNVLGQPLPKLNGAPREIYDNLHPYVRRNGPEGDYHLLTPAEFHPDTSELWQRLAVGHHGVTLTDEEKGRLLAWMDLNVPFYGTWSETGCPDPKMIARRRELEKRVANITFDPEAIPNPYRKVAFEAPAGTAAPAAAPVAPLAAGPDVGTRRMLTAGALAIPLRKVPGGVWMGETEVTLAQMRAFDPSFDNGVYDMHYKDQVKRGYYMNDDPVFGKPENVNLPAVRVSFERAQAFCAWLSEKTGRRVRLPTESEWESAARAGAATPFFWGGFGDDFSPYANLADVTRRELAVTGINPKPIPNPSRELDWELKDERFDDGVLHLALVGSYRANAYGLHDMVGNAAEWTSTDFTAGRKVVKGGSFNDRPHKALLRWGYPTWMRPFDVGFRVVVEPAADVVVQGRTGADIQRAVETAAAAGGGRVVVPAGDYAVGSIRLKSGVELHLARGAVLKGGTKSEDYDDFPDEICSIHPEKSKKVLVYAYDAHDIAITGAGVIDGQGPAFFDRSNPKAAYYPKPPVQRPRMVQFVRCKGVRLQGVTFKDSPCWTMLIRLCEDISVDGITITADQKMINNDGIDFDGCRRIRVGNSRFKTCDDCLILRAMREKGASERVVCEDVVVSNCVLNSCCQTIRLGCPSDDTIRNALFKDIVAEGRNGIFADFPARYLRPDDEGYMDIRDITVENYSGTFTGSALQIVSEPGVKVRRVDGFVFRNLRVKSRRPLRFIGNLGHEIGSVRLENVEADVEGTDEPCQVQGCNGLVFRSVSIRGEACPDGPVASRPGSSAPLKRGKAVSWETTRKDT